MNSRRSAFTLLELLIVVVILLILFPIFAPHLHHSGAKAHRIKCVNNLKNTGLAFVTYAGDNSGRFPWQTLDQNREALINNSPDPAVFFRAITNELVVPKLSWCPVDSRKSADDWKGFSRENLSYFLSPDASHLFPQSLMAGDRNLTNSNGRLKSGLNVISIGGVAGWDETMHQNVGNVCMGDGSVQQMSGARLREALQNTGQTNFTEIKVSVP